MLGFEVQADDGLLFGLAPVVAVCSGRPPVPLPPHGVSSIGQFRRGEEFLILELNGAASEATSAYDGRKSLREAYALLFKQWELVFAIGDDTRRGGPRGSSRAQIVSEWRHYRQRSFGRPLAD